MKRLKKAEKGPKTLEYTGGLEKKIEWKRLEKAERPWNTLKGNRLGRAEGFDYGAVS